MAGMIDIILSEKRDAMKEIAVLLAEGFEEAEAITIVDFFRRLDQKVEMIACGQEFLEVISYHEIAIRADVLLSFRTEKLYDAIMLPGGPVGARKLGGDAAVVDFVKRHITANRLVCPFCSAGAHVMAANKLLGKQPYTCSGDNHTLYEDGRYVDAKIVKSGNILTGKGLGVVFEYACAMGQELGLGAVSKQHLEHIYFEYWNPDDIFTAQ